MNKIIIFGFSITSKLIIDFFNKLNNLEYELIGIIDDDKNKYGDEYFGVKVIGDFSILPSLFKERKIDSFILAIASYKYHQEKQFIYHKLISIGLAPVNCVSDSSYISSEVTIGKGNLIYPLSFFATGVCIGDNCMIDASVSVLENTMIKSNVHICSNSFIGANCLIDDNVYIGPGSTIASGVRIGKRSIIGAGSVVLKDIDENVKGFGNPFEIKNKS